MRRFLLLAHRVPTGGEFTLNDLAGGAGRMDEIARAVSTAFTLSNDLRRDTELTVLFVAEPPPKARRIDLVGGRLRYLNPDERSTAALLKNALVRAVGFSHPFESSPGLTVAPVDPASALREFVRHPNPIWLCEDGEPIEMWASPGGHAAAIISDPYDPTEEERELLRSTGVPRVSVGPRSLRTSQVVDLVHHELDLREAGRASAPPAPP
ncbi:MAG TPA: tRNA (pseudouridine(54)-N(1))-methyltransferase TrmY [Thermoplasmata archaeon]|nr:tRNA (pseudouridine(54)-N(1))-methyltransferase TrmY [Thermoplasmata archaeon]